MVVQMVVELKPGENLTSKRRNEVEICRLITSYGARAMTFKMIGFCKGVVSLHSREEANKLLKKGRLPDSPLKTTVPTDRRIKKGIIKDWDSS